MAASRASTKPPPTARQAALRALVAVERNERQELRRALDVRGLSPRDGAMAFELAQGTERRHLTLDFVLRQFLGRHLPQDPVLVSVLRLGACQLLYLPHVSARATVDETVKLLSGDRHLAYTVLRRIAQHVEDRAAGPATQRRELPLPRGRAAPRCLVFDAPVLPAPNTPTYLAIQHGLPSFLVEAWHRHYGATSCAEICEASGRISPVVLRATAAVGEASLVNLLAVEGVAVAPLEQSGMFRVVRGRPFETDVFKRGLFLAQDPTAFAAACAVGAREGETILDLCAAPGGKTMALAEAVGPTGKVLAFDVDPRGRQVIAATAARLRLQDRISIVEDARHLIRADRVLVDAPSSNTGNLSRCVEARRRLRPDTFEQLRALQCRLLMQGLELCRRGGVVVYSTGSILGQENREVVNRVLMLKSEYRLAAERLVLPGLADGGYCAVLAPA